MGSNRDIIVKLRLAGEQFDRDFKVKFEDLTAAAERASEQSGTRAGSNFGKSFAKAAGVASGALGAAIGVAINAASDLGQELASTSKQFNIGVESLQVWRQAAANAGVRAEELKGAFGTLAQKIGEANDGNRKAQQSFVELGIGFQTTAGNARATDEVMADLARRIAEIKDPAERARVGTQLLGDNFKTLYPLLVDGADGLRQARTELGQFGAVLSQDEIRNLEKTNAKIEQMKTVLSIRIAGVVAENADAIVGLTDKLLKFAVAAVDTANAWIGVKNAFSAQANRQFAGIPTDLPMAEQLKRAQAIADADARRRGTVVADGGPLFGTLRRPGKQTAYAPMDYITPVGQRMIADLLAPPPPGVALPRVTGGGGPRRTARSAADSEAERAAKEALRAEQQFRDALARTLQTQRDVAEVARIRAQQGDMAAARAEAELGFLRQQPLAVNTTVEALAKALGITKALTDADRQRLQLLVDQGQAAKTAAGDAAARKVMGETLGEVAKRYYAAQDEEKRTAERQAEAWRQAHERAVYDVANIFETAFRGGTRDLWAAFKDEGIRIIAEIAAQWTLAMVAGQKFDLGAAASGAFGRSPLSSLFFGVGGGGRGGFGGMAANDNGLPFGAQVATVVGRNLPGGGGLASLFGGGMSSGGPSSWKSNLSQAPKASFLSSPGFSLALGTTAGSLVAGSNVAGQIGGMVGSIGGQALGSSIAALGAFGGPVGAIIGGLLGAVIPALFTPAKRASVTVGNRGGVLGITGSSSNDQQRLANSTSAANSLIDAIFQISNRLGGSIDPARGAVSIGMRKNDYLVDPTGRGAVKTKQGAISFGGDQQAAIRFAISDLIKDGVITGISQASQNLLQKGGDLDRQVEKALLIEQIPKLLKQRLDPLGAALDDLYDKFKKVNDALVEGSASAEQFAQARQLWELEKADAIKSIGAAAQTLKDFLASLNAGSNSPLSLREQRAEAEKQLAPYLAQIDAAKTARAEVDRLKASGASDAEIAAAEAKARGAAAGINQQGFADASQLLLSISRQTNASSGAFFSDFDRIRALTGQAIGFIDQASARSADARDPFGSEIAKNTQDMAALLADNNALLARFLAAVNDNAGGYGSGNSFISEPRSFAL